MAFLLRDRSTPDMAEATSIVIAAACFSAANPLGAFLAGGFAGVSYLVRRSDWWINWVMQGTEHNAYEKLPITQKLLLPGPVRRDLQQYGVDAVCAAFLATATGRKQEANDGAVVEDIWSMFNQVSGGTTKAKGKLKPAKDVSTEDGGDWLPVTGATKRLTETTSSLADDLKRLPKPGYALKLLGKAPESRYAVPIGINADGQPLWLDFERDILHMGLYGTSGGGKDTHLRMAFYTLTKRCSPEDIQFFYLDGKGDWLLPMLKNRDHMWRDPAGGTGAAGRESLKQGIEAVQVEMTRRLTLVQSANCRTREAYIKKTGDNLPLLVVVFSDVMDSIGAEIETLLIDLVSKARAVGIRVVVSMQTPTGASMKWRSNLSTNISAVIPDRTQDAPALGLAEKAMLYRPSELPSPKQRPGVMIVRHGDEQHLVQGAYMDEDAFDAYVEVLPQRSVLCSELENAPFLGPQNTQNRTERRTESQNAEGFYGTTEVQNSQNTFDETAWMTELTERYAPDKDQTARTLLKAGMSQRAVADELRKAGLKVDTNWLSALAKELK